MHKATLTSVLQDGDLVKASKFRDTGKYRCVIGRVDGPVRHGIVTIRILHVLRNWSDDGHGRADTMFVSFPQLSSIFTSANLEDVEPISEQEMGAMLKTGRDTLPAWVSDPDALEKAQALGFATIDEALDHEQWLEKNGSPQFKAWLQKVRQCETDHDASEPSWFANLRVGQWKVLVKKSGLGWDDVALRSWVQLTATQRHSLKYAADAWLAEFRTDSSAVTFIRNSEGLLEVAYIKANAEGDFVVMPLPPGVPWQTYEVPPTLEEKLAEFKASLHDGSVSELSL